jgi:uncharacterized protein YndB with AHSA1/START domain
MTATESSTVQRTVTVEANPGRAFDVFTAGIDTWWPKSHHIGAAPMKESKIECRVGGRCYTEHEDGASVDWGKVLVWEPPHRLVLAWQVTHQWGYEPDLAKASEVEVRFTALEGARRASTWNTAISSAWGPAVTKCEPQWPEAGASFWKCSPRKLGKRSKTVG